MLSFDKQHYKFVAMFFNNSRGIDMNTYLPTHLPKENIKVKSGRLNSAVNC